MTNQIEIGRGKRGRRAYSFDDVSVVPARRTRDPRDVNLSWRIDAYTFDMPVIGAPMDSVMSPATAIALGRLGGLGVLNLEGLWTRHEDPEPLFEEIAALEAEPGSPEVTRRLQEIYAAPIRAELITERLAQIREAGVVVAGSLTPQHTQQFYKTVLAAGVDLFVIRGTTVSAEHVSETQEPLDLKQFIYELDVPVIVGGAAGYTPALHLMRTGAAGVLVGFGGGASSTTRRAMGMGADAVVLGGALARATEAPGRGWHWGLEAAHHELPRGHRTRVGQVGPLEEVLWGPGHHTDGTSNLMGALKRAMATSGYTELKDFQKVEVLVTPAGAS